MTDIPKLSTIAPLDRVDAALKALEAIPLALEGSILTRNTRDGFLSLTTMSSLGYATVERVDDEIRHTSSIRMISPVHEPIMVMLCNRYNRPKPERSSVDDLCEFARSAFGRMQGAVLREEGSAPPSDANKIALAFELMDAAFEAQSIFKNGLLIIRPSAYPDQVRAYVDIGAEEWDVTPAFQAQLAPLCQKSDDLTLCGTDETWARRPLITHKGHMLRLETPEQMGREHRPDPVTTLRVVKQLGEGPWFTPAPRF